MHAGHKGLFADRLDAGLADSGGSEIPRFVSLAEVVYRVRNRDYMPTHGRWLQQDPVHTGRPLLGAAHSGTAHAQPRPAYDDAAWMESGPSLFQYLASSPLTNLDPLGTMEFSAPSVGTTSSIGAGMQATYTAQIGYASSYGVAGIGAGGYSFGMMPGLYSAGFATGALSGWAAKFTVGLIVAGVVGGVVYNQSQQDLRFARCNSSANSRAGGSEYPGRAEPHCQRSARSRRRAIEYRRGPRSAVVSQPQSARCHGTQSHPVAIINYEQTDS